MSHAYIVSGILPVRMAFPCLAQCLLGQTVTITDSVLVESFIDTMSPYESSILRDAFSDVKRGSAKFSASMQSSLLTSLSRFGLRKIPTPDRLRSVLAKAALFEFLLKPSAIISSIFSGVPTQHKSFWNDLGV